MLRRGGHLLRALRSSPAKCDAVVGAGQPGLGPIGAAVRRDSMRIYGALAIPASRLFSPRGKAKCVRGPSVPGACRSAPSFLNNPGVLEPYVEHGEQAQRSNGGPIALFDRHLVRKRASAETSPANRWPNSNLRRRQRKYQSCTKTCRKRGRGRSGRCPWALRCALAGTPWRSLSCRPR